MMGLNPPPIVILECLLPIEYGPSTYLNGLFSSNLRVSEISDPP